MIAGATTQLASQAHLATVYYNRVGLDTLVPKFRFYQACSKFPMPQNNGKTMQMWRDNVPGYNTTPAAEGVPLSTPFVNGSAILSVTVENYSDFMSNSALIEETSIVNEKERQIRALSIRAAGAVDTIVRQEIDSNVATVGANGSGTTTYLCANDFKKQVSLLEGANVDPFDGTRWLGIFHPYNKYDLITDSTAGGFIETLKYQSGVQVLNGEVGEVGGVRLLTSTNVGNDGVAATSTKYYAYVFGFQAIGVVELDGRQPDGIVDPKRENFKISSYTGGGAWDPTNEIGTVSGYRFVFAAKTLDTNRFKIIKNDSSIV